MLYMKYKECVRACVCVCVCVCMEDVSVLQYVVKVRTVGV